MLESILRANSTLVSFLVMNETVSGVVQNSIHLNEKFVTRKEFRKEIEKNQFRFFFKANILLEIL